MVRGGEGGEGWRGAARNREGVGGRGHHLGGEEGDDAVEHEEGVESVLVGWGWGWGWGWGQLILTLALAPLP